MSAPAAPMHRMRGPSAMAGGWRRFAQLSLLLAVTDFKLRFFGSVLGYVWTLMRPLLLFAVLYTVFSEVVRVGQVPFYGVVLLTGIVIYEYFAEATGNAVVSVLARENLVRKVQFPGVAIPVAVTLTAGMNILLNFVVVGLFIALAGVEVRWSWLELPFLLLVLAVFTTGVSMLMSALFVPFRDIQPIWEVVLRALFYATPVIYPIEQLAQRNEQIAHIAMCNPLAVIIEQVRHAVIDPTAPSAAAAIGGSVRLLIPAAVIVGVCVAGVLVFNRMAPRIAEDL